MFEYVHKGDFMFVWDLTSGYHHLDLFPGHQQSFAFSFDFQGKVRYLYYTVLTLSHNKNTSTYAVLFLRL